MPETQAVSQDQINLVAKESQEIIAGYTLEKRLGSGGFGEVWKASAPGGLEKAVKIIYGQFDDEQAETELKSLERIRALHHPFLLNIERVEICAGRLVIVSELAEGSLEDYYADCRKRNLEGIPYEELVELLRDAADALDYMSAKHGLQHLDVKPDNLLIQGGHVKVADFGLTKDLSQTQVSLVGAFTPLYAPPELYEGNPAPSSDQYSLAIVYQAMLTGVPPFVGRTAAQLAAQHLRSQPNLEPLAITDRPAVARALSKNPDARFSSCREFLEELERRRTKRDEGASTKPKSSAPRAQVHINAALKVSGTTELVDDSSDAEPFRKIEVETKAAAYRPTLFVGLGGLAGDALRNVKYRMEQKFGTNCDLPAVGFLYLDTDREAVAFSRRGEGGALAHAESLAIPLRSPQDYKNADEDFSNWLSRRWLYNIPRSRNVESMRPLGRLAFADHHEAIREAIKEHFTRLVSEESLSSTKEKTGLNFQAGPIDVVVMAAITGGTGSGAALDLGYLIQDVLSSMALESGRVEAVFLFGTDFRDSDREVAMANAVCLLKEYEKFQKSGFPGDPTCRLQEMDSPPFDNAYVFQLGDNIRSEQLDASLASLAEYVYRKTLTPASAYFEKLQAETKAVAESNQCLHTFWTQQIQINPDVRNSGHVPMIRQMIAYWCRPANDSDSYQIEMKISPWCDEMIRSQKWGQSEILDRGFQELVGEGDNSLAVGFQHWLQTTHPQTAGPNPKLGRRDAEDLIRSLKKAFSTSNPNGPAPFDLLQEFQSQLTQSAQESTSAFEEALWEGLDVWQHPFESARFAIRKLLDHLEDCHTQVAKVLEQLAERLAVYEDVDQQPNPALVKQLSANPAEFLREFADAHYCFEVHQAILGFVGMLRAGVATSLEKIGQLCERLNRMSLGDPLSSESTNVDGLHWIKQFDKELARKKERRLRQFAKTSEDGVGEWVHHLAIAAERFIFLSSMLGPNDSRDEGMPATTFFEAAKPRLLGAGGFYSGLLVTSADDKSSFAQASRLFGHSLTAIHDENEPAFLCCETRNLTVRTLTNMLSDRREDLKEVASRLHARIDVDW